MLATTWNPTNWNSAWIANMHEAVKVFTIVGCLAIFAFGLFKLLSMDPQFSETKRWDIEYVVDGTKYVVTDARSVNVGQKSLEYVDEEKRRVVIFPKPSNIKCVKTHE